MWCRITYTRKDLPDVAFVTTVNVSIDEQTSTPEKLLDAIRGSQVADKWMYLGQLMRTDKITVTKVEEIQSH